MTGILRSLTADDAHDVARVFARSRAAAMPWLPVLHGADEDEAYFAQALSESSSIGCWIGGDLRGFAVFTEQWLLHLYVDADHRGQGIGSALLREVLGTSFTPLELWAFAGNEPALDFYRSRGFVEVERTDGSGNEERMPDVRLVYAPSA